MLMQSISEKLNSLELWKDVQYINVRCDDRICSSVTLYGSLQNKSQWTNQIFQNSPYFTITIQPKNERMYSGGDCTVQLIAKHYNLPKMRKFSGTPEKCIDKIKKYVKMVSETVVVNK